VHYRNLENKSITEQQATLQESYLKVVVDLVTNLDKTIYQYKNGNLQSIQYYIEDSEDINVKINELKEIIPLFNLISISTINEHSAETIYDYANDILHFKTRFLLDKNGHLLCEEVIDINSNLPVIEESKKYLYNENGEEILMAEYKADGDLAIITYKPEGNSSWQNDWEYYEASTIVELEQKICMNLSYYLNADLESNLNG